MSLILHLLTIPILAVRIACFGDSVTAGYGVELHESWCSIIGGENHGIGANNTYDALARIQAVIDSKPKTVFVSFGLNDAINYSKGTIPVPEYKQNLERIIRRFKRAQIKVVLQTGTPTTDVTVNAIFKPYVEVQRKIAKRMSLPLVDNYARFSEAMIEGQQLYFDYGHPNASGHKLIADNVLKQLRRIR